MSQDGTVLKCRLHLPGDKPIEVDCDIKPVWEVEPVRDLPIGLKKEIVAVANLREWRHISWPSLLSSGDIWGCSSKRIWPKARGVRR